MQAHKDEEARGLGTKTQLLLHWFGHEECQEDYKAWECRASENHVDRKEALNEWLLSHITFVPGNGMGALEKYRLWYHSKARVSIATLLLTGTLGKLFNLFFP